MSALSKKAGLSQSLIGQYIRGELVDMGVDKAKAIAEQANVSAAWLMTGDGEREVVAEHRENSERPAAIEILRRIGVKPLAIEYLRGRTWPEPKPLKWLVRKGLEYDEEDDDELRRMLAASSPRPVNDDIREDEHSGVQSRGLTAGAKMADEQKLGDAIEQVSDQVPSAKPTKKKAK